EAKPPAKEEPAPTPDKPAPKPDDDPFKAGEARPEKIQLDALRVWTDESGEFQVTARLALILDGKVRLLKETGKYTTVPIEKLSAADQQFVRQAVAQLAEGD